MVGDFLYRITEPVLRPIRNVMPNLGGIDISPVILIIIIFFIRYSSAHPAAVLILSVGRRPSRPWPLADGIVLAVRLTPRGGRDASKASSNWRMDAAC